MTCNTWIAVDANPKTQLTYAVRTTPHPLTVSVPNTPCVSATLKIVITNQSSEPIDVNSIRFTMQVGTGIVALTTDPGPIQTTTSGNNTWVVDPPNGAASYTLLPSSPQNAKLAPNSAVILTIFEIPTGQCAGSTTLQVTENTGSNNTATTNIKLTLFPAGFYLDSLLTQLGGGTGSTLVPVAQVSNTDIPTLTWNSSVTTLGSFSIYYSSAAGQQGPFPPTSSGEWTPKESFTSDTVFMLCVNVTAQTGETLTAAISTVLSVQNPDLVVASVTSDALQVGGPPLEGCAATITGDVNITGEVMITGDTQITGTASAANASIDGTTNTDGLEVSDYLRMGPNTELIVNSTRVAMLGAPVLLYQGSDSDTTGVQFPTDGLLLVYALAETSSSPDSVWAYIATPTQSLVVGANSSPAAVTTSFATIPMPARTSWSYQAGASQNPPGSVQLWWYPLGTGSSVPFAAMAGQQSSGAVQAPAARTEKASSFIDTLSQALGTPLQDDVKARLTQLLRDL